ncbi:MAG TPA: proline racemase family protein [Mycobacteriales bacterium]|nr:proline racemase family protein [Mycobacteriales bacterium]
MTPLRFVDTHTEGMPTRVVLGGMPELAGNTVAEQMASFVRDHESLRRLLVWEPRGAPVSYAAALVAPDHPDADVGVFFAERNGVLPGCGHGTIGVVRALLDAGTVTAHDGVAEVTVQTPSGLVHAVAREDGGSWSVELRNVASFLHRRDLKVEVPGFGPVAVDVAFGGNFYAIVPAGDLGLTLEADNAKDLAAAGLAVMHAVDSADLPVHPAESAIRGCLHTLFTAPGAEGVTSAGTVVIYTGVIDRSPCGTGTSARMAQLHARGELALNEDFVHSSLIGSRFVGRLVEETTVAGQAAVVPTIRGRAWVTGRGEIVLEDSDPFPAGFVVADR